MNKTKNKYGENYFGNLPSKQITLNKKVYAERWNNGNCPQSELGGKSMKRKWLWYRLKNSGNRECPCCKMKSTFEPEHRTKSWNSGIGTSRVVLVRCSQCWYSNFSHGGTMILFRK